MKQLDDFNKVRQEIFDYFGYVEDWVAIPIDDRREMYWRLKQNPDGRGKVTYHEERMTNESVEDGHCYENSIYTQRFLPKWVYKGKEYTMICVDTHTDGNRFLAIYDNDKEQNDISAEFVW